MPPGTNKRPRYALGIFLIILVAVIWVSASQLIQHIYKGAGDHTDGYKKPIFLTYFNTINFSFWLLGFGCNSRWRRMPKRTPPRNLLRPGKPRCLRPRCNRGLRFWAGAPAVMIFAGLDRHECPLGSPINFKLHLTSA